MRAALLATLFFFLIHGGIWLTLRRALPTWWEKRAVRAFFAALTAAALVGFFLWSVAPLVHSPSLRRLGVNLFRGTLTLSLPLALTLPIAALVIRVLSRFLLPKPALASAEPDNEIAPPSPDVATTSAATALPEPPAPTPAPELTPSNVSRRRFIHMGSSAIPAAALSLGAGGLVMAQEAQRLPIIPMRYPGLPPDLHGLKILHLSDLHLGYFMHVPELRACLARAAAHKPDLIVFTGDIADDLEQLGPAMEAAAEHKPRLGVFAAIGNHEHFRGLARVRRIFDKGPVPLLLEQGTTIDVGSARLRVTGADDPVSLRSDIGKFMKGTVARALDGAPSDAFHLLLCHRPDGFPAAADEGVDLTLSGHTHGVQIGFNGRSLFESRYPERYLWGAYERGESRLYTSSGFGHWFPFRLNCPTEAPIIVLERA